MPDNCCAANDLIGDSRAILGVRKLLERIALRDASVLIEGETGTGKEVVARAVHYASDRRTGPFIPVNCGAIPDGLLESELFGYRQGAFTDAKKSSPGILPLAHGGTLLLDEVDSLSVKAQVALLRFLQERTIRSLGDSQERKVDVRVIAATNKRLDALVKSGQFRQDLYYRLKVMYLELPPLRDRDNDVQLLAKHFLKQIAERYRVDVPTLDTDSRAWLGAQPWPGNIRELENLIESEFLLHDGGPVLRISVLNFRANADEAAALDGAQGEWNYRRAKAQLIEQFDRQFLDRLMTVSGGNVTLAARTAGKERRDLGRMLRKYKITPQAFRADLGS